MRVLLVPLFLVTGCWYEPCDNYVDYLCVCHEDDPEFDCEALKSTLSNADPETQDECAVLLSEQQDEDEDEGLECEY